MSKVKMSCKEKRVYRSSNFDLMGIAMMLCVIMRHVAGHSGKSAVLDTTDYYVLNFLRSFCMMAVNVFVIRSGYFGITLKREKIFRFDV